MIRETELIAQFTYLERQVLLTWIEEGVIAPHRDDKGYLFDRVDESRVALACDCTTAWASTTRACRSFYF